jgi:ankyrin repeat protein
LHWAALYGYKDVVALLLASKAEVNALDNDRRTPLLLAADSGYKDVVALLLPGKAQVNAKDHYGQTPLHKAADKGNKDVAEWLRRHGGDE